MALENVGQQSFSGPSEDNQAQRAKNVCCVCNSRFQTVKQLHQHFSAAHEEIQLKHETHVFHSDEDFSNWKKEEEMKSKASFVQRGGGILGRNQKRTMYYICNRSGVAKIKTDRKRHAKLGGSVKCGKTCPAFMKAIKEQEEGIKITVEYQSTHVGHEKEVGKLRLHSDDKKNLAAQMKSGVPSNKILESIRSTCPPTTRLGLTTKKDLHNICSRYKIDEAILHKDDALSVDMHVRKMRNGSYDPILIYKPIGSTLNEYPHMKENDFMLSIMTEAQEGFLQLYGSKMIMVDATHGTNQYGLNFITLMVSDDNHEGLPVAITYANRTCSSFLEPFFYELKKRLPSLAPQILMSDDDPAYSNAWRKVFGPIDKELLCKWHLSRNWNKNINEKIKNHDLRQVVKTKLEDVATEVDKLKFELKYKNFVMECLKNEESKAFITYFLKIYGNRTEKWAYFNRVGCGVNTNMKLERWHREIKYESAGGRVMRRLDKSLHIVLGAINKKVLGRIVSIERHKLTSKVKLIRQRHEASEEMNNYSVIEMENGKFIVSKTNGNKISEYEVNRRQGCDCQIKCHSCNICIHYYSCTCLDYAVKYVICKHIHFVCKNFPVVISATDDNNLIIDEDSNFIRREQEKEAIINVRNKVIDSNTIEEGRQILQNKFEIIMSMIKTEEDLQNSEKYISAWMNCLETSKSKSSFPTHENIPSNRFIMPQRQRKESRPSKKQKLTDDMVS